ncbi:RpiB/LacA/LacB family sugar-phosphate isomerase [candidate division WWE3 bacterium]|nr:RpiB/LacA/LacB family sugar-phosphate isomerase [candidate division WWE3 bacterium]
MLILAADHGGFELKEHIKKVLGAKGLEIFDAGNTKLNPADDYPDFVEKAVLKLKEDLVENKAILFCRSGSGEVIVANKFPGVRATLSWSSPHAAKSREHNNTNVLAIPSDYITEQETEVIIDTWLATPFSQDTRHVRRLQKITDIEQRLKDEQRLDKEKVTVII